MYKITIEKITIKVTESQLWKKLHDNDNMPKQYGWVDGKEEKTIEDEIYTQLTDKEINLKKVIDAFNQ